MCLLAPKGTRGAPTSASYTIREFFRHCIQVACRRAYLLAKLISKWTERLKTMSLSSRTNVSGAVKIAVHAPAAVKKGRKERMYQFFELLGMRRERTIFLQKEVCCPVRPLLELAFTSDRRKISGQTFPRD